MRVVQRRPFKPWKMPRRKAFTPTGVTPGATVIDRTRPVKGQVWAQAPTTPSGRWWYVVDDAGTAHECWERDLIVLGQCIEVSDQSDIDRLAS